MCTYLLALCSAVMLGALRWRLRPWREPPATGGTSPATSCGCAYLVVHLLGSFLTPRPPLGWPEKLSPNGGYTHLLRIVPCTLILCKAAYLTAALIRVDPAANSQRGRRS